MKKKRRQNDHDDNNDNDWTLGSAKKRYKFPFASIRFKVRSIGRWELIGLHSIGLHPIGLRGSGVSVLLAVARARWSENGQE